MKLKNWNLFEIIWLSTFSFIAIMLTVVWGDTLLGFSAFITGVLCVVFAAKGNILTYVFGMYNTFAYAYLAYTNGLYGEVGLNLLFFIPMNVIGFIMWKKKMNGNEVKMRDMKVNKLIIVLGLAVLAIIALGYGLSMIEGQNSPYIDATTNILSIIATILMVLRFKEQWVMYIILNIFTVFMWSMRTINGSEDGTMMIVMWSAYLINAFYGYYTWNKGAKCEVELK